MREFTSIPESSDEEDVHRAKAGASVLSSATISKNAWQHKDEKGAKVMTYIAKPSLAEVTRRMNQRYKLTVWWSDGSLTTVKDLPLESAHRREELINRRDDVVRIRIEPLLRQDPTSSSIVTSPGLGRADRSA